MKDRFRIYRDVIAFWILGLLNNFLYVTMNAGAENINEAGIALVYLANILPTLLVKLTGPYWFHYVSYRCRMNFIAILMVFCLCIVAWGDSTSIKLLGVAICSLASGVGEASLLAMASFYETKPCLAAWSSGTGFAGIAGYAWSLAFDAMNTCFQVQLMVALWIPIAWYFTFFYLLGPPWIDKERGAEELACGESEEEVVSSSESVSSNASSEHSASEVITGQLSAKERFCFIAGLWPYMVPLFLVYAAEYTIQAGFWAAMGFPVTNRSSRHAWYKWANFTYQIGVFISRSSFVLICKSRKILWLGGILQVIMVGFFGAAATLMQQRSPIQGLTTSKNCGSNALSEPPPNRTCLTRFGYISFTGQDTLWRLVAYRAGLVRGFLGWRCLCGRFHLDLPGARPSLRGVGTLQCFSGRYLRHHHSKYLGLDRAGLRFWADEGLGHTT
ncbi:unnamed protein product [Durusdinium trenchii]|uniref:Protein BTN n=1 Tax=Durusdinium trenchii TaxID=1381693 RepID=A0ABP0RC69_9DINO